MTATGATAQRGPNQKLTSYLGLRPDILDVDAAIQDILDELCDTGDLTVDLTHLEDQLTTLRRFAQDDDEEE